MSPDPGELLSVVILAGVLVGTLYLGAAVGRQEAAEELRRKDAELAALRAAGDRGVKMDVRV